MPGDNEALLLQVSADLRKLEKAMLRDGPAAVDKGSRAMEKRAQQASTNLERFFGKTDPGKALDKIFDSTRFKVLDSGVARIGLFGSALESLGPAGLAAAAAIGAVSAAFAGARDAARFADDIADTANRLHVTTDALQEYRYAIHAAGGDEKGADDALESFSVTLGKAQAGMTKAQRGFLQLGFTKDQIKGFTDADTALKAVTEKIAGLSSVQQDAVIDQLGLTGLKPLIEGGVDSMQRLREEAHKVGIVMDADLVKRGGELNDQFETVSKVIDVQLKSALVDLGPILVGLLQQMADLARFAADVADSFRDIEHKRTQNLKDLRDDFQKRADAPALLRAVLPGSRAGDLAKVAEIDAELAKRATAGKAPPIKPTRELTDTSAGRRSGGGAKAGPRDDTAQRVEQVNATLAGSGRDLYQAMLGLTGDINARAEIEKAIADQEAEAQTARLDKQIADLKADEGISNATRDALVAKLEIAKINAAEAAGAKQAEITREAAYALEDRQIDIYQAIVEAQIDELQAQADIATTAAQRVSIEKKILDLRQQLASDLQGTQLDRQVAKGEISPEQRAKLLAAQATSQGAERTRQADASKGPLQKYLDSIKDVDTAFQTLEANGISSLIDGLAAAGAGAANLGDVFRQTIQQMAIDANRILLQSLLSGATGGLASSGGGLFKGLLGGLFKGGGGLDSIVSGLAAGSPFFASGTDFAPGGMATVGEHGPEKVYLPRGAQVIPNDILRSLAAAREPGRASGGSTFAPVINIHAQPGMTAAEARRTGRQAAAAFQDQIAVAKRSGF